MSPKQTSDDVEALCWGEGSLSILHGSGEGEWLGVENEEYFIDPEQYN